MLLAVIAFIIYCNSLWNGFVWDDAVVIVANIPLISNPLDIFSSIDAGRSVDVAPYYRPLSLFSFYIEYRLHALNPFLVRLSSLIIHACNTFLVYQLASYVYGWRKAALFATLLFAVHPIHAEAVDFNSARSTLLVTLFSLLAIFLHRNAVERNKFLFALGGALAVLAGLLSKEVAIGVIPFIAALEVLQRCNSSYIIRNSLVRLSPYVVSVVFYWVLRSNALDLSGARIELFQGLLTRLIYNAYIIPKYILSLAWPLNLSPFYLIPEDLKPIAFQLIFSWIIITAFLWWIVSCGTQTAVRCGIAWLVIFWLPVSGIVDIPSSPVADRYFYMPALGIWLLLGEPLARLYSTEAVGKIFRRTIVVVLFLCLAGLTFRQNQYWKNGVTVFSRVLQLAPESVYAYHNLGCAYLEEQNNLPLAENAFIKAMALDPAFPRLHDKLGYIKMQQGDFYGALLHYRDAVRQNPLDAEAHLNSAVIFEKLLRYEDALYEYQRFYASPGNELEGAKRALRTKIAELSRLVIEHSEGKNTLKQ